jgi:abortive infection bacteriophage resistance protein
VEIIVDTEKKEKQKVKKPTTFEEQVNILRERNLQIGDTQYAIEVLSRINYYRLSAYMLSYK